MPTLAIAIFVAVFAVATFRNIHLGVLMLPAAVATGVWLAGMPIVNILAEFPVNILFLIGGVTFFFGIAQANGTIDVLVHKLVAAVGDRRALLPFTFFLITAGVATMGSSQAAYIVIPLAMAAARRAAIDPMLMGIAVNSGMSTGGFAPTSLFGMVTLNAAGDATPPIGLDPFTLLGAAAISNLALLAVATWMFRGPGMAVAPRDAAIEPAPTAPPSRFAPHQIVTLISIVVLILAVVIGFSLKFDPDPDSPTRTNPGAAAAALGAVAFALGAVLALLWPKAGAEGVRRIDWSTIFMVGAIVTFVGVLEYLKADTLLGDGAVELGKQFGTPLVAAFAICVIAGLVSAFASTTAIIAMLVPLATAEGVAGGALLCAVGVCASIVDASPFSTTGALIVAAGAEEERPRLKMLLFRWGLSMVIVGPAAAVIVLALL